MVVQAVALFQQGRLKECEDLLRRAIAAAPRDHAAVHLLGVLARERGDHARAIELLRTAVSIESKITPYHGNLGNAYLMAERFEDAAACYRHVLTLEPGSRLARFGLGMAHLGRKDFAAAATELGMVVKADVNHFDAQSNLGTAFAELGRHDEAAKCLECALALRPNNAGIHLKYGEALRRAGDLPAACRHFARAALLDPSLADAPYLVGVVLHAMDRLDEAAHALDTALKLRPNLVAALYERGQVLNRLQAFDEAADCFERGLVLDPRSPALYQGLARTRHSQGRCPESRALIAQALAHGGDVAECQTMLGLVHQTEGNFAAATAAYQQAVAVSPTHAQAQLCLAMISKSDDPLARIRELERLRELDTPDAEVRTTLEYALARSYENAGDHDAAFSRYKAANDLRKARYPFDGKAAADVTDRLIAAFSQDFFTGRAEFGSASERPVFIVGMMRSGTTLVEQILASHPLVHGHGELGLIPRIADTLRRETGDTREYPECIAALDSTTAGRLAAEHLKRLTHDTPDAARDIDKLPHNFMHLGLIASLFPRARIIHCTRDPIDTCLSGYMHDFGSDHRFTNDLDTLGRYYRDYQRLMEHWRAVLPNPVLDVSYEALVADQEGWSRRLVDFLGLAWDERCLAFHAIERPVFTYSMWQVRQPIFTTSVQRWRRYAAHLGPLLDALETPGPR